MMNRCNNYRDNTKKDALGVAAIVVTAIVIFIIRVFWFIIRVHWFKLIQVVDVFNTIQWLLTFDWCNIGYINMNDALLPLMLPSKQDLWECLTTYVCVTTIASYIFISIGIFSDKEAIAITSKV